jgi:hypothetical protein
MNIVDKAGIWREVKAMSKAKISTKTGMRHFQGLELETLLQQRQRLLDVVVHDDPSRPYAASARFLWHRHDEMVDALSADSVIKDADEKKEGAKALEEAADNVIDAFICVAGAHDAIPYMHYVSSILIIHACHIYVVYLHYTVHIIARHVMSLRLRCVRLRFLELGLLFLQVVAHISEWIEERGYVNI